MQQLQMALDVEPVDVEPLDVEPLDVEPLDVEPVNDKLLNKLKEHMLSFRDFSGPASVSTALLEFVSEICERSITFVVRPTELAGDKAIGVDADRSAGPTSATRLKILETPSVFSEMLTRGQYFYGETDDET
jgi:hypothetical protein